MVFPNPVTYIIYRVRILFLVFLLFVAEIVSYSVFKFLIIVVYIILMKKCRLTDSILSIIAKSFCLQISEIIILNYFAIAFEIMNS